MVKVVSFQTIKQLATHIKSHVPTLYRAAGTSRVVPFETLDGHPFAKTMQEESICLGDLSSIPPEIQLVEDGKLLISGAVSWSEAREYAQSLKRDLMSWPTDMTASVLAGISTSATGERSFGMGTLRNQVLSVEWMDFQGELNKGNMDIELENHSLFKGSQSNLDALKRYQNEYESYKFFKNAPFPRLQKTADLMIGTEGQLGITTQCLLKTRAYTPTVYLFIELKSWTEQISLHLNVLKNIQQFRGKVLSCELIDQASLSYVESQITGQFGQKDLVVLELEESYVDEFLEVFPDLVGLNELPLECYFQVPESKFHQMRAQIPRKISEATLKFGRQKLSSDVQVPIEKFEELLRYYQKGVRLGNKIPYVLFGHFGDAHLHFNLLPRTQEEEEQIASPYFEELYQLVKEWNGSPFAEHGIGVIKQKYMKNFYGKTQLELFKILKQELDPYQQFFPHGYMSL